MPRDDLTVNDLQAGDLVIWKMGDNDANHCELFTGGSHFDETSIHAVNTPAKGMQRVMPTSFRATSFKHIFRCGNPIQVRKATKYARAWSSYENRYDTVRINVKSQFRNMHRARGTTSDEMAVIMSNRFMERGRFRAVKYAARRAGILCYPGDDGESGKGMTCCMFAITCYQAAGIASEVNKLDPAQPRSRVSDKKMSGTDLLALRRTMLAAGFSAGAYVDYVNYVRRIQSTNEYDIDWSLDGVRHVDKGQPTPRNQGPGWSYRPSVVMWRTPASFFGFDWAHAITPGMMLDSKIATPHNIYQSLLNDSANWAYLGTMAQPNGPAPTAEQKDAYQAQVAANQVAATARRHRFR